MYYPLLLIVILQFDKYFFLIMKYKITINTYENDNEYQESLYIFANSDVDVLFYLSIASLFFKDRLFSLGNSYVTLNQLYDSIMQIVDKFNNIASDNVIKEFLVSPEDMIGVVRLIFGRPRDVSDEQLSTYFCRAISGFEVEEISLVTDQFIKRL